MSITSSFDIKANIGKYELIHSGIINLFEKSITLKIRDLVVDINFEARQNQNSAMEGKAINNKSLSLTFINMNNALLEGFYSPMEFGNIDGRKLYMNFAAWTLDSSNNIRTLVYNVFLGENI